MSYKFSSYEINGIIGSINIGDVTVIGILSAGTVIVTLRGATVITSLGNNYVLVLFSSCGYMLLNSVSSLFIVCNCLSQIVKEVLGPEFFNTCINSLTDLVACYVVDNPVIIECFGNSTTYVCIFPLSFGV